MTGSFALRYVGLPDKIVVYCKVCFLLYTQLAYIRCEKCEICLEHISSISTGNNYSILPPSSDVTSSYLISRYSL